MRSLPPDHVAVQAAKFIVAGLFSASGYSATIFALVELAGVHTAVATTIGFAVGTVISYTLNTLFTFQRKMQGATFVRFWVVTTLGLGLNVGIVEGVQLLGLHYGIGVFAALVIVPVFNFTMHRTWTYRHPEPGSR